MTQALLEFSDLTGGYGDTLVVRELASHVPAARVLGVLGRNGVGKTTLLRLLMGYLEPRRGRILWSGRDVLGTPPFARVNMGMGYAPQEAVVFDTLSVLDNLTLHRRSRSTDVYAPYFEAFPRIKERLRQEAGSLSGGEKKIVSFTRALAGGSRLVLLDEPTEGVQQENIARMVELIRWRRAQGDAFIIVEQNLGFLAEVMDDIVVLDHGRCVLQGNAADYARDELERYLMV
ncbi:MAG TPA: ATP-binding cassette domain-containing protein [Nevskiaceae bacterium]